MYKYLLVFLVFAGVAFSAMAQGPDTTILRKVSKKDTLTASKKDSVNVRKFAPKKKVRIDNPDSTHSPHTAVMRSLIVPGLGQIYNHHIWKVPIIYGGLGALVYSVIFNITNYKEYETLSKYREHGVMPGVNDPYYNEYVTYTNVPSQSLYDAADFYRRDRDLSYFGILAVWGVNVIDAYIGAKFIHSYTVDDNLSMRITPGLLQQPTLAATPISSYIPGIKITFTLR